MSLINQSYNNLQIILIDDGSTDNSGKICDDFSARDARILVIHQKNQGVSQARNKGLINAKGDYVLFVDADDWLHIQCVEILLSQQRKFDSDIVFCRNFNVKENKADAFIDIDSITGTKILLSDILSDTFLKSRVWARLYRRELLNGIDFLDDVNLGEDTCFNLTVVFKSKSFVLVEHPLYYYFIANENSLVHTANYNNYYNVGLYYFEQAQKTTDYSTKRLWFTESVKVMLACRYLNSFSENKKFIAQKCNAKVKRILPYLKKVDFSSYFKFFILYIFPFVYRLYRISTDKTMIKWEKQQKKAMQKNTSNFT